ncbi:MAG: hypothetical protein GXP15_13195 [Gammaproteobacteria bacterium]|nr:hypothetical protein [Gammaproteobacteria bacterium]
MFDRSQVFSYIRRSMLLLATVIALGATQSGAYAHKNNDNNCYKTAVESLDFVEMGVSGKAKLCVNESGLKGDLEVNHLTPGNPYTVWWVYIDDPGCPGGGFFGCIATFFGDDPLAVFGRMDSGISPHKGHLEFSDKLDDMQVRSGSQVWFLVFGHGPASTDGRLLARQLLTPEDPTAGAPHLGVDANGYPTAVAIFELP